MFFTRPAIFVGIFISLAVSISFARIGPLSGDNDLFFSIERVEINPALSFRLISRADGRTQKDIAEFAVRYTEGSLEYSRGNFTLAADSFIEARKKWPEYFYADFAAALSYEAAGEYDTAARYYKSYLNKLRAYRKGHYGISAPLILSFSSGRIEDYDYAYGAVKRRLSDYGIRLEMVTPARSSDFFPVAAALFFTSLGLVYLIFKVWIPFAKKKIREKNPPEGFWICPGCGACTPELSFECSSCGKEKPGKKM
jgi:tetratricopeptide (TPR) repeat protein